MSTILKALNKAEPKPTIVRQRIGAETSPRREVRRSIGHFRKKRGSIYLLVAMILCVVGIGSWQYIGSSSVSLSKQPIKTYRIISPPPGETIPITSRAQVSNRQSDTHASVAKNRNPKRVKPSVDRGSSHQASRTVLPRQTNKESEPHSQKQPIKRDLLQHIEEKRYSPQKSLNPSTSKKDQTRRIQSITDNSIEPNRGKKTEPGPDNIQPWRNAPPLENSKIKLQALAWSRQPEKRMVVIDGQVVREGDDVSGYTVKKIQENDIILQQNERFFRLSFNR
jgi:hypothetical protein